MSKKTTPFERDCQLVRDVLADRGFNATGQVLKAFARIERRATTVKGNSYILHVIDIQPTSTVAGRVCCGRLTQSVNTVHRREALKNLDSEQWCQRCVARIKKETVLR